MTKEVKFEKDVINRAYLRSKEHSQWMHERSKERKRVNRQQKTVNIINKYGPSGKPAPVVIKSLHSDEVLDVKDQDAFRKRHEYSEHLNRAARNAGFTNYEMYLRSPHWKQLRERVLARDHHRCTRCKSRSNLQVHHDYYDDLHKNDIKALKTLCQLCHSMIHEK